MIQMVSADIDGYSNAAPECLPDSMCLTFFQTDRRRIKGKKYLVKMKSLFCKTSVFISLSILTAIP